MTDIGSIAERPLLADIIEKRTVRYWRLHHCNRMAGIGVVNGMAASETEDGKSRRSFGAALMSANDPILVITVSATQTLVVLV